MSSQLLQALLDRYGVTVSIETAAEIFHYPTHRAARAAITRGTFPVPCRHMGAKLIISTHDIAAFLAGDIQGPAPVSNPKPQPGRKRGRPRKTAQVAVQAGGAA